MHFRLEFATFTRTVMFHSSDGEQMVSLCAVEAYLHLILAYGHWAIGHVCSYRQMMILFNHAFCFFATCELCGPIQSNLLSWIRNVQYGYSGCSVLKFESLIIIGVSQCLRLCLE